MAYKGYVLKIGAWTVPNDYINPASYSVGVNEEEIDGWTGYDDTRHAVYSLHKQAVISFETPDKPFLLTDVEVGEIQAALAAAKHTGGTGLNPAAYMLTFYDPKTNDYIGDKDFTLGEVTYPIEGIDEECVKYRPIKFTFTEVNSVD